MLINKTKEIIEKRNINLSDIARAINCSYQTVYDIISKEDLSNVRLSNLDSMAIYLGVNITDLYCREFYMIKKDDSVMYKRRFQVDTFGEAEDELRLWIKEKIKKRTKKFLTEGGTFRIYKYIDDKRILLSIYTVNTKKIKDYTGDEDIDFLTLFDKITMLDE